MDRFGVPAAILRRFALGASSPACTAGWLEPSYLVAGVFLGSTAWWILLCYFAEWFGRKLNTNLLHTINVAVGLLLVAFGAYELFQLASHLM